MLLYRAKAEMKPSIGLSFKHRTSTSVATKLKLSNSLTASGQSCHVGFASNDGCGVTLARQPQDTSFVLRHWSETCVGLKREKGENYHHWRDALGQGMLV